MSKTIKQMYCIECESEDIIYKDTVERPFETLLIFKCNNCGEIFTDEDWEMSQKEEGSGKD